MYLDEFPVAYTSNQILVYFFVSILLLPLCHKCNHSHNALLSRECYCLFYLLILMGGYVYGLIPTSYRFLLQSKLLRETTVGTTLKWSSDTGGLSFQVLRSAIFIY